MVIWRFRSKFKLWFFFSIPITAIVQIWLKKWHVSPSKIIHCVKCFLFENIRFKQSFWLPYQNHEYWLYFKITQVIKLDDGGHKNTHEQHQKRERKRKSKSEREKSKRHLMFTLNERVSVCVFARMWVCSHIFNTVGKN